MSEHIDMKKYFRVSQKTAIIGNPLSSRELAALGVPFQNAAAGFSHKFGDDSIDMLLGLLERYYPKIHAVSYTNDSRILNTYVEGAMFCLLHEGDPDPDIEFTEEFSWNDLPEGARADALMFESGIKTEDAVKAFKKRRGLE